MAKRKRRSFGKFLRGAVKDVVVPTSMGLGLALGGCGSSGEKADGPMAVMPPAKDAAVEHRDGYAIMPPMKDAAADYRDGYAIMPPKKDAAADTRDAAAEFPFYAIMPLGKDAAPDTRDAIYAIMDAGRVAGPDAESDKTNRDAIYAIMDAGRVAGPDAESDKVDSKPDTTKPLPKDVGPIFAIMPLAVLPPDPPRRPDLVRREHCSSGTC